MNGNVLAQSLRSQFTVTGEDRVDDAVMLGKGIADPIPDTQLQAPVNTQFAMELAGLLLQIAIVAGGIDREVEFFVCVVIVIRIL